MHKDGFAPPKLVVTGKLGHPQAIQVEDFKHLEKCISNDGMKGKATTKVCIPS
jgi:5-methyltetrahydropteroyltriglutamate--homocysteine methyltransferase